MHTMLLQPAALAGAEDQGRGHPDERVCVPQGRCGLTVRLRLLCAGPPQRRSESSIGSDRTGPDQQLPPVLRSSPPVRAWAAIVCRVLYRVPCTLQFSHGVSSLACWLLLQRRPTSCNARSAFTAKPSVTEVNAVVALWWWVWCRMYFVSDGKVQLTDEDVVLQALPT